MYFKSLLTSMFITSSGWALPNYDLISVPHSEIDTYMTIASDATHTPKNLQGLWWMDGNPIPDEVISFATAEWRDIVRFGRVIGHEAKIPLFGEGIWSWHDSQAGRKAFHDAIEQQMYYYVRFNNDYTYGVVTPQLKPSECGPAVKIPSTFFLKFTMTQVSDDEFLRVSTVFGNKSTYRLRRLVDANGQRTAAWDEFLEKVEVPDALFPVYKP